MNWCQSWNFFYHWCPSNYPIYSCCIESHSKLQHCQIQGLNLWTHGLDQPPQVRLESLWKVCQGLEAHRVWLQLKVMEFMKNIWYLVPFVYTVPCWNSPKTSESFVATSLDYQNWQIMKNYIWEGFKGKSVELVTLVICNFL